LVLKSPEKACNDAENCGSPRKKYFGIQFLIDERHEDTEQMITYFPMEIFGATLKQISRKF